mmetsp:Transcript_4871/g.20855  ORF Transcript_4871/g.20855 Transcript_4871/m.20855 type:complete len:275 (+) Transcript_4871:151-975(+)
MNRAAMASSAAAGSARKAATASRQGASTRSRRSRLVSPVGRASSSQAARAAMTKQGQGVRTTPICEISPAATKGSIMPVSHMNRWASGSPSSRTPRTARRSPVMSPQTTNRRRDASHPCSSASKKLIRCEPEPMRDTPTRTSGRAASSVRERGAASVAPAATPQASGDITYGATTRMDAHFSLAAADTTPSVRAMATSTLPSDRAAIMAPVPPGTATNRVGTPQAASERPELRCSQMARLKCSGTPPNTTASSLAASRGEASEWAIAGSTAFPG